MPAKLYVGNLSWSTEEPALRDMFGRFGNINEVKVVKDRDTGRSQGYGFVTYAEEESAENAKSELDGEELDGRPIKVNDAIERY